MARPRVLGGMGKASKQRTCPAVGHDIPRGECGENRVSRYACPESCSFNPFSGANYEQLLAIEDDLDKKAFAWLVAQGADGEAYDRDRRQPAIARSGHGLHAATVWHLFFRVGEDGRTCAQRLEQAGFPGLKNDDRVLLRAKMQTRVVLLEVRRVIDGQTIEALELLEPGKPPLRLVDRSLAARAARFSTLLGWAYPLPHFWRLSGTAIAIPDFSSFDAREIVTAAVAHLGGPGEPEAMRRWLAEHFVRLDNSLSATGHERRRRMFASIDAQWGTAVYELRAPFAECRAALDAEAAVGAEDRSEEDRAEGFSEARVWFDDTEEARRTTPGQGRPLLGTILLGTTTWRLQTGSGARLSRLRELFEACLGRRVHFIREQRDDVAHRLARKEPAGDPALVVPRLVEPTEKIILSSSRLETPPPAGSSEEMNAALRQDYWRTFGDVGIPALEGRTPREAARDPALRPRLVELMKRHVRQLDEDNLRTGRSDDLNWLVRELGLDEIDVPPPPRRATPAEDHWDDHDEDEDFVLDPDEDDFPDEAEATKASPAGQFERRSRPATMLPSEPFDLDEASRRLQQSLVGFDTAAEALDELEASGSMLIEDMRVLTDEDLDEGEFSCLVSFLLMTWFSLVPRGSLAPELDFEVMEDAYLRDLEAVETWFAAGPEKLMDSATEGCRQPALLQLLMARVFESTEKMPKKVRPKAASLLPMIIALKALIIALDDALRGEG